MSTLSFVANASDAEFVAEWTEVLSEDRSETEYICLTRACLNETESALRESRELEESDDLAVSMRSSPTAIEETLERCRNSGVTALVTNRFSVPAAPGVPSSAEELTRSALCQAYLPLFGDVLPRDVKKVLVVVRGGVHDMTVLRAADRIAKRLPVKVTVCTVETNSGDQAEHAGVKEIQALLHSAALDEQNFEIKVVVDPITRRGILKCVEDHELILAGTDAKDHIWPLREALKGKTVFVVKRSPPLRLRSVPDWFPRINPRDHAELLSNLRQGSRWGNDFIVMLALAAAIASLGLMQNSPAVVIGSMLLAPLMTPMIGAGLGIAQANVRLAAACGRSIAWGFLLTLGVSFLLGLITPARETLSPEVLSRGTPNILDLLIALFAALAATYSMARPNLSGAMAGVAIATALVPPVCAIGLSLSLGFYRNALGASVLFFTNLIAIIVASSLTFTLLGVSTVRSVAKHRRIIETVKWVLVGFLFVLAGPLSAELLAQLEQGRNQTAIYPVTRAVSRALHDKVAEDPGVHLTMMGRSSVWSGVYIQIAADHDLPKHYANELRDIVRREMEDDEVPVTVICLRGQWRADSESSESADETPQQREDG